MIPSFSQWKAHRKLSKLQSALELAQAAYEAAVKAGDTRRQGETYPALKTARHDLMRAEIAFLTSRSRAHRRSDRTPGRGLLFQ